MEDTLFTALVSFCCFFPACIICVYFFLHILLPLAKRRRYGAFILAMLSFVASMFILNYFASVLFFFGTCHCNAWQVDRLQIVALDLVNTLHAVTTAGLIFGFRITKNWLADQKANQLLFRSKIASELKLQRTKVHPRFMLDSLQQLREKIDSGAAEAPEMLLKLSDVLSYLLYDSAEETISLDHEIEVTKSLVYLEQSRGHQHASFTYHVAADTEDRLVKPLVLFSAIRNLLEVFRSQDAEPFEIHFEVTSDPIQDLRLEVTWQHAKGEEHTSKLTKAFEVINPDSAMNGRWRNEANEGIVTFAFSAT